LQPQFAQVQALPHLQSLHTQMAVVVFEVAFEMVAIGSSCVVG
jgi:hypothetical protein